MRRAVSVVLLATLLAGMAYLPATIRPSVAAKADDLCAPALNRYVMAPDSRVVEPEAIERVELNGGHVTEPDELLRAGGASTRIERLPGSDPIVVVDFGQVVSGGFRVETTGSSSPELRIAFSESLAFLGKDSDLSWLEHHSYAWRPPAGASKFETGQATFRYVMLFLADDGWVKIDRVWLRFTPMLGTPDTYAGCFESSDDELNRIWYAGAYTLELNTTDPAEGPSLILDGAKRDRAVWVGDLALEALVEYVTHNRTAPVRDSLADLAAHQRPDGAIPPTSFANYEPILYDYSAWWVTGFVDYYRYSGDRAFAERYYPNLHEQMAWFPTKVGSNGLLVTDQGIEWMWTLPRLGEVAYTNILYYRALLDAAELAAALGHQLDAAVWRSRAAELKQAINERFFDPVRGIYRSHAEDDRHITQDANALAVLFEVAPPERWAGILDYLEQNLWTPYGSTTVNLPFETNSYHDKRIWLFMGAFEVMARFQAGDAAGAYELVRREWGHMLRSDPASTTWEWLTADGRIEDGYASLAHGWSAGATPALTQWALGVRLTEAGYRHFDAVPHPGDLGWARGRVPTPHGPIDFTWTRSTFGFSESLTVPAGTQARAGVPTFGTTVTVTVNGLPVWDGQAGSGYGARSDGRYVYLDLKPGSYRIDAEQIGVTLPTTSRADPGTTSPDWTYFPETGHYLASGFRAFWQQSGGLPVFGYPLTEEFSEFNVDTGRFHTTQYLERQRFEYHPELAGTLYEVQLGRLGAEAAETQGLQSLAPFQPLLSDVDSDENCTFFAETDHRLCSGFKAYWQTHGLEFGDPDTSFRESLALFGYPISEEFTDPATGLTVQYFERARFEYHPNNSEPYRVLLGRLGADLIAERN